MNNKDNQKVFLIDFLNIAHLNGKPRLRNYELVRDKLLTIDPTAKVLGIADPHTRKKIKEIYRYEKLKKLGEIIQVGPDEKADFYLVKYAENKPRCFIITNDRLNPYKPNNGLKNRIIPVTIILGEVIFSNKLEKSIVLSKGTNI